MEATRRLPVTPAPTATLFQTLVEAGLEPRFASLLEAMPHKILQLNPKRPFREPSASQDEVIFVRSGILCKYKTDGSGRRQIVALRFPGEGILPREGPPNYGIQAIVRSEIMVGRGEDFRLIIDAHPELSRFLWRRVQRNESIGYEWLVNCGRRDSIARVAHLLCETAARIGIEGEQGRMINPFTQQQIADITGQTSVNVNRVLADLQRQGMIERSGREILFRDWEAIRRLANFQPSYLD